jgi:DNA-binding MarR family transcriptional regulator
MISKSVRKELLARKPRKEESIGRLIYFLYRYLAVWGDQEWPRLGSHPLGPSHIHLLATIGLDGVSNSEMARRAKVSKQAMRKLVREMLKNGLIVIQVSEQDSRCNIITLTDRGAGLLIRIWEINDRLTKDFEKRLGRARSKRMVALMAELVDSLESDGARSHS